MLIQTDKRAARRPLPTSTGCSIHWKVAVTTYASRHPHRQEGRLAFMPLTTKLAVSMQFSARTPLVVKAACTFLRCGVGDVCLPVCSGCPDGKERNSPVESNLSPGVNRAYPNLILSSGASTRFKIKLSVKEHVYDTNALRAMSNIYFIKL